MFPRYVIPIWSLQSNWQWRLCQDSAVTALPETGSGCVFFSPEGGWECVCVGGGGEEEGGEWEGGGVEEALVTDERTPANMMFNVHRNLRAY